MPFLAINRPDHKTVSLFSKSLAISPNVAPDIKSTSLKQRHEQKKEKDKHRVDSEHRSAQREHEFTFQSSQRRKDKHGSLRKVERPSQSIEKRGRSRRFAGGHKKNKSQPTVQLSDSKSFDLDDGNSTSASTSSDSTVSATTAATTSRSQPQPRPVLARTSNSISAPSSTTTNISTPCPMPKGAQRITIPFDPNNDPATIEARRQKMIQRAIATSGHRTYSTTLPDDTVSASASKDSKKRKHEKSTSSSAKKDEEKKQWELRDAVSMQVRLERLKLRRSGHIEYQHLFSDMSDEQMDNEIRELNTALAKMWKDSETGAGEASSDEAQHIKQEDTDRQAKKQRTDPATKLHKQADAPRDTFEPVSRAPIPGLGPAALELQVIIATNSLINLLPNHILTKTDEFLKKTHPDLRPSTTNTLKDLEPISSITADTYENLNTAALIKDLTKTTNLSKKEAKKIVKKHRNTNNTSSSDNSSNDSSSIQTTTWRSVLAVSAARDLILQQSKTIIGLHGHSSTCTAASGILSPDYTGVAAVSNLVCNTAAAATTADTGGRTPRPTAKYLSTSTAKKHKIKVAK